MIDPQLIEECRNGNLQSFRKLIEASSPYAFSVALRMIGDEELAKDIVQETMITVWLKMKKIKSPGSFKTWMYRIVMNKCYDHFRKMKKQVEETTGEKTWALVSNQISENPDCRFENNEIAQLIKLLTVRLSPVQKAVFVLSDLEEMTAEEIEEITGMSRRNIKANLHYARKRIGEMIEKYL